MMNGSPRWIVSVTHIPSGITVTRDSNHYRNQHLAKEAAIKYLKSKLYMYGQELNDNDVKYSYMLPDDNLYPRYPKDYRRATE